MGQVVKTYLGIFFLLLLGLAGIGIVSAGIETSAAQNYHADVISEIECSNFNSGVLEACKSQAAEAGYALEITPMVWDEGTNIQAAEVILEYKYAIDILELTSNKEIRGFAR